MTRDQARNIVTPFYTHALTVNAEATSTAVLGKLLAEGFESINSQETKTKAALMKQVEYFWKLIPNLRWAPKDFVIDGDKVSVRSVATGSPKGSFMGLELDGTRSFSIDTTDIHELLGEQIVRVHHLEDWATAIRQLSGPPMAAK